MVGKPGTKGNQHGKIERRESTSRIPLTNGCNLPPLVEGQHTFLTKEKTTTSGQTTGLVHVSRSV